MAKKKHKQEEVLTRDDIDPKSDSLKSLEKVRRAKQRDRDNARQDDKTVVNCYAVLVFQNHLQLTEFTDNLLQNGVDSAYGMYYNGEDVAEHFGIELTPCSQAPQKDTRNEKLSRMVDRDAIERANRS